MPRPKTHYRLGKYKHLLKDSAPQYHQNTPDADNLAKILLDCMNGMFYDDDKQVVELNCIKRYIDQDEQPKTIVMLDYYEK